ncbi:uncharacterized protein LOC119678140 isoform X1 [Teleopsis dalmanni]|uniref:uncharacterized protein LOC119678140 isoform X1 n=1 Tax=Teleopsis dalmanni TaxID=139649 RepID=UPI0018CDAA62|nr:uncharacterized protein LOC119678140 isoform X1 [Teleopsis dalmanni]
MVQRTLIRFLSSKRVPLIKFRIGGNPETSLTAANQASASGTGANENIFSTSSVAIEDWELHPRFWRKPITADEIDYINRGGPD